MRKASLFILAVVTMLTASFSYAQPARRDFNRPQTFDALHYVIRASFDRPRRRVIGETTITLKSLKADFRTIELDAIGISFDTVRLASNGAALKFVTRPGKIVVTLDRAYEAGEQLTIHLKHSATPQKGVYFREASAERPEQIWTQGEPDEARHWFPSFDFPSDKATTEQFITVPEGDTVIGNGELVSRSEAGPTDIVWHYKMRQPIPIYLVSFVVGKYVKLTGQYKSVPLAYYTYAGKEETTRKAYDETERMMAIFEELTGVAYPFSKYDQTVVSAFQFGGMENVTATTMADTEIFSVEFDGMKDGVTDLVSHELAHSWFGNLVTCRNWAELWLNEGFATFMEAAYRERTRGREDYMASIRSDAANFLIGDVVNPKKHGLFNQRADNVAALFDTASITYNKGGAVIHTLREQVGNAAFWKGVNIYLNRHRFGSVETADLKRAIEETSGQELGWFFEQWIYAGGSPRLEVRQNFNGRTHQLTVTISQTQRADKITPAVFRLPLDVEIRTPSGTVKERVEMKTRAQVFTFKVDSRPTELVIDKEEKIPVKRLEVRPLR